MEQDSKKICDITYPEVGIPKQHLKSYYIWDMSELTPTAASRFRRNLRSEKLEGLL